MTVNRYDIQELTEVSGVPRRTIYFYVQQGILPPPDGAGLAARYTDAHYLRLRLIPILRQQGLRLDDIRDHFAAMSEDALRAALSNVPAQALIPAQPRAIFDNPWPGIREPGERYLHYRLPAGMVLVVPDTVNVADRQRLERLLQAAKEIFNIPAGQFPAAGSPEGSLQPSVKGSADADKV